MGKKRKGNSSLTPIGGVIQEMIGKIRPLHDQHMVAIWDLWSRVLDPSITANARPAAFRSGTLVVHVSGSSWIQQLRFMEKQIVEKLNKRYGARLVERISFRIGQIR